MDRAVARAWRDEVGWWNWAIPAILSFASAFVGLIGIALLRNRTT